MRQGLAVHHAIHLDGVRQLGRCLLGQLPQKALQNYGLIRQDDHSKKSAVRLSQ
jgi:hypothetical protein